MPILALGAASIKASVSFESAFASVRKTVDATVEEYQALSDSAKRMSTEVATSADTIAEVMANAGQLGIRDNYLVSFSRTMIDIGNSTDLAAGEAATAIAKFANVTKMAQTQFSNFGSSLVDLGNNFATTESAVMSMATRLAAADSQGDLSQARILGFATTLSSVGLEAEAGGTAFSKAMIQMQVAVETGNDSLSDFAKISGMTRDSFAAVWRTDPSAAIQAFIVGLSQMDEQGVSSIVTLEEMGFSEVRLRDTLMRATNATELFSQAQKTATSAWAENTALSNEAAKRYATTESKLKNLKNTAILFGQQLGDDLNPTIQSLADGASDLLAGYDTVTEFLEAHAGDGFDSIAVLFGAAEDEAMRVLVDLGLSEEGQTLKDWIDGHQSFDMTGTLTGVPESITLDATVPVTLTDLPESLTLDATAPVTLTGLPDTVTVEASAPATITGLPDGPVTILANVPTTVTGLSDSATIECDAPVTLTGVPDSLSVQANAPVTLTGVPESITIPEGVITNIVYANGAEAPGITVKPSFDLSALDKSAIDSYYAENPDKKPAVEMEVGLKSGWENLLGIAYSAGTLSVFGADGAKLEVSPALLSTISPTDIIRYETDESGGIRTDEKGRPVIDVIVVPKLGTKEAVEASAELVNDRGDSIFSRMGLTSSAHDDATTVANTLGEIDRLGEKIAALKAAGEVWDENGIGLSEYENMLNGSETMLSGFFSDLSETDLSAIATDISAIIAAIQSGELSAEDGQNMLDPYLKLLSAADTYLGTGNDISAEIAAGMTAYGWDTDAETVAQDVDGALRTAFDSHSPANRTKPIGNDIAEGVGVGMAETNLSGHATETAAVIEKALRTAFSPEIMRGIGRNASYGLGYGILSGEAFVIAAIRTVARASVTAAKQELKINSPSAVFRDEVGRMGSRGIGVGFELEAKAQAKTIQNASRYLVGIAQVGVDGAASYDNRRTYNYNAASAVQVDKLYARDEKDIYALAVETASLTRRRQRGRGLRMA